MISICHSGPGETTNQILYKSYLYFSYQPKNLELDGLNLHDAYKLIIGLYAKWLKENYNAEFIWDNKLGTELQFEHEEDASLFLLTFG